MKPFRRFLIRIGIGASALMLPVSALSQLKPCSSTIPAPPYKVFVDGMRVGPSLIQTEKVKNLKARIGAAVENNLAEIKLQLLDTELKQQKTLPEIRVIPCDDTRFPTGISAFSAKEMKGLSESRVLLEIWGDVLNPDEGTAYMGYALAPAFKMQLPAVYSIRENIGQSSASAEQLFRENRILKAYAEVVVGIQFYRNDDFDAAAGYLCGGALKLEKTIAARPTPVTSEEQLFVKEQQKLISGVRDLGGDAIKRAAQSPASSITAVSAGASTCPAKEN
jgi:hypothetical protein